MPKSDSHFVIPLIFLLYLVETQETMETQSYLTRRQ